MSSSVVIERYMLPFVIVTTAEHWVSLAFSFELPGQPGHTNIHAAVSTTKAYIQSSYASLKPIFLSIIDGTLNVVSPP